MTNEKICNACLEPLPLRDFTACASGKFGVVAVCKECKARKHRNKKGNAARDNFNRLVSWPAPQGINHT